MNDPQIEQTKVIKTFRKMREKCSKAFEFKLTEFVTRFSFVLIPINKQHENRSQNEIHQSLALKNFLRVNLWDS